MVESASESALERCPTLTASLGSIGGVLRTTPEDFVVEEVPAYEPSGEGEHLYVRFSKRGLTTDEALRALARALGADPRTCGVAGMKDKHAVTTQTVSIWGADAARALALALPGITVHSAKRHANKLRTGHLHGNRFVLVVRGCDEGALARAREIARVLLEKGVPNYYGAQRFGFEGRNAERGRAWLRGEAPAPRDAHKRKLFASAVQSELFNQCLAERVRDGLLDRYVDGDLAERHPVGRPFAVEPAEAQELYASRAVSPTGPMFGPEMRWPERDARAREQRVLDGSGLTLEHFARARDLASGTRRAMRMVLDRLEIDEVAPEAGETGAGADAEGAVALRFSFTLPAGGYATAVLREFRKTDAEGPAHLEGSAERGPAEGLSEASGHEA